VAKLEINGDGRLVLYCHPNEEQMLSELPAEFDLYLHKWTCGRVRVGYASCYQFTVVQCNARSIWYKPWTWRRSEGPPRPRPEPKPRQEANQ